MMKKRSDNRFRNFIWTIAGVLLMVVLVYATTTITDLLVDSPVLNATNITTNNITSLDWWNVTIKEEQVSDLQTYAVNNSVGWILNFTKIFSDDWSNVSGVTELDPVWNANWSTIAGLINNASYLSTYNATYAGYATNVSINYTLNTYTNWNSDWLSTYNSSYAENNTAGWILNFTELFSLDWTNVSIIESQVSDADWWDANTDIDNDEITEAKIAFSTACAAGNHYYLNGNDLACEADDDTTYTGGDAITLDGTEFDFDGGASPSGELGGSWANPTIDSGIHDDEYEGEATHFDVATTANITCLDDDCNWFTNATDSCMYWPSGGKDCGAA